MNLSTKPFQQLSIEDKARFFVHIQSLLVKYHPNSDFIFRQDNSVKRIAQAKDLFVKYKGLCYADENIAILFNKIFISDPTDAIKALRENMFQPPNENYNGVSLDFVVFRSMNDCLDFCKSQYDPQIRHIIYSKTGRPQIYRAEDLIARTLHLPIGVP
jgi:hypothetical protein